MTENSGLVSQQAPRPQKKHSWGRKVPDACQKDKKAAMLYSDTAINMARGSSTIVHRRAIDIGPDSLTW